MNGRTRGGDGGGGEGGGPGAGGPVSPADPRATAEEASFTEARRYLDRLRVSAG